MGQSATVMLIQCKYYLTLSFFVASESPLQMYMIDGGKATASGDGLKVVSVREKAHFRVSTRNLGTAELAVRISCE